MAQALQQGNVVRAATWLLLGVAGGLCLDLCAKELLRTYSLNQFVLLRSSIACGILLTIAPRFGGLAALRTEEPWWHVLRTLLAVGAMFGFFYGLAKMPLVNALTLGYTAPLIVTALSALLLGDKIGWRRWSAVIAGFIGVLIMLRPDRGTLTFAEVAVLIAAFCYACQAITARRLSASESTLALSFYVIVGPLIVSSASMNAESWLMPDLQGWVLMFTAATGSVVAWIGFVNGYRAVSPATLAPLEYIALVIGAIAGFVFWNEVPDHWVVAGAVIIVASGIFVVYRGETRKEKAGI